jgi:methyl-accepting chemotaxis protein
MDTTTWLAVITGVMALALFLQALALVGLWRAMSALSSRVDSLSKDLMRNVSLLSGEIGQAVTTIKSVAEGIHAISGKLAATSDIVHKRIAEVDSFLREVTDTARLEIARIQDAIDTTSRQIEETFALLHRSVLVPVREVSAILRGFRVGLDFVFRRHKGPSSASPQDEEMFIG